MLYYSIIMGDFFKSTLPPCKDGFGIANLYISVASTSVKTYLTICYPALIMG